MFNVIIWHIFRLLLNDLVHYIYIGAMYLDNINNTLAAFKPAQAVSGEILSISDAAGLTLDLYDASALYYFMNIRNIN